MLAKVDDEQQVAKLIEKKSTFKGPFDVRLATAPHMTQGRQARQVGEPSATVTPVDATQALTATQQEPGLPAQASQFQVLAARPALGIDYNDSSRPMVKKVIRIDKQRPEGAVPPARDLYKDITCSDLGTFFQRGSVFASYVAMLAYARLCAGRAGHQRGGHPRRKAPRHLPPRGVSLSSH